MEGIRGHEAEEDDGVREDAVPEGTPPGRPAGRTQSSSVSDLWALHTCI